MSRYLLFSLMILSVSAFSQDRCVAGFHAKSSHASRLDTLDIVHQNLTLDFTTFSPLNILAQANTTFAIHQDNVSSVRLDLEGLQMDSVLWGTSNLVFTQNAADVLIGLSNAVNNGDTLELTLYYHGTPIADGSWGGFYANSQYAYNLGVGFDSDPHCYGRVWHPCVDDFQDRATYDCHVLTLATHRAYCGGVLTGVDTLANGNRLFHWSMTQSIPSYLASVAVASYVHVEGVFNSEDGDVIPVWLASKATDTTHFKGSLIHLDEVLHAFEHRFGPYPFDRVGYVAVPFNGGAMEHACNIAYPLFAIDGGLSQETLYAHELSHMWWGDAVTCAQEEEMWLNEGWASYCESLALEALYGQEAYWEEQRALHKEVLTQAHRDDGGYFPVSGIPHTLTYGTTVYRKGAWVVHNLRHTMGDSAFFQACRDYQALMQGNHARSLELQAFFQSYTPMDLTGFFNGFVFAPGFPEFRVDGYQVGQSGAGFEVYAWIEQHTSHAPDLFVGVPLELTVKGAQGESMSFQVVNGASSQLVVLDSIPFEPRWVLLNGEQKLHEAVLAEEAWVSSTGVHNLTYAETNVQVSSLGGLDSLWIRAENHFAAAHEPAAVPFTNLVLNPDRFWVIYHNGLPASQVDLKLNMYGGASNYYDSLFASMLQSEGFTEDSLHLFYKPLTGGDWQELQSAVLNTLGNASNYNCRFDVADANEGFYAYGYYATTTGVSSKFDVQRCPMHKAS